MTIPEGMREVTKEEFFRLLYAACTPTRDIMPSTRNREFVSWEDKSRTVWGWSFPGWGNRYDDETKEKNESRYAVKEG